ncbi:hypothetical protein [Streptomyces acidicola]|uniref:hypothetical protein n=1 Tax=Streptomyces acidicola TaxID=2596892 RepID=UPI0037FB1CB7
MEYDARVHRIGLGDRNPRLHRIEHALKQAELAEQATLTDLHQTPRDAQGGSLLGSIRTQSSVMLTDLTTAFDAVVSVPTVTRDLTVSF